jgi:type IV pilus assembly protein PilB
MMAQKTNIGSGRIQDILVHRGILTTAQLTAAEQDARAKGTRLERYLAEKKLVNQDDMVLALSEYLHRPPFTLAHFVPVPTLMELIPIDFMKDHLLVPVSAAGKTLTVALGDPFDLMALDELKVITGMTVTPVVVSETQVSELLAKLKAQSSQASDINMEAFMKDESDVEVVEDDKEELSLDEMLETAEGAPVIRMVNLMLVEALRTGASDIHIEPMEKKVRLRYRIDGNLQERPGPPKNLQAAVVSRIKIMADLDIAERRMPQDGRFNIKALGKEVDLRVSILPTVHGEKVVMRTLDRGSLFPSLYALGLDEQAEKAMAYAIAQPHGIILVTGPTGSGKTTTLYSCLQELNQPDVNIITCEDPVEYQLEGINQVQINADVGLSFASALRSILRQDPDIVLVGEVRDGETAEIAVKAALTGHLVLSTLHTNDAAGAVTRLIDMGVQPFMLGSSLVLAQAQRLYRKLCTACRKPTQVPSETLATNRIDPGFFDGVTLFEAAGCPRCNGGYKGRGAIMEVLLVDDAIREAVLRGANTGEIRAIAKKNGMVTLKEAGLVKVKEGVTSLLSAIEVTGGE